MEIANHSQTITLGGSGITSSGDELVVLGSTQELSPPIVENPWGQTYCRPVAWTAPGGQIRVGVRAMPYLKAIKPGVEDTVRLFISAIRICDSVRGLSGFISDDGPIQAAVENVTVDWGDGSTAYSTTTPATESYVDHVYSTSGTYTVTVVVNLVADTETVIGEGPINVVSQERTFDITVSS